MTRAAKRTILMVSTQSTQSEDDRIEGDAAIKKGNVEKGKVPITLNSPFSAVVLFPSVGSLSKKGNK